MRRRSVVPERGAPTTNGESRGGATAPPEMLRLFPRGRHPASFVLGECRPRRPEESSARHHKNQLVPKPSTASERNGAPSFAAVIAHADDANLLRRCIAHHLAIGVDNVFVSLNLD